MPEGLIQSPIHQSTSPVKISDVYPLDEFYVMRKAPLPVIGRLEADEVPEPYHSLLVHKSDMTSTLEKFHGEKIHIEIVDRQATANTYFREVILVLDQSRKVVEFGAIKIMLDLFPVEAQKEILEEHTPLGRILSKYGIKFSSHPSAFLRVQSDLMINVVLHLAEVSFLYGRRNTLMDAWDRPLAEIVEILPP